MFFFLPSSFLALAMLHTMLGCGGCGAVREMASHLKVHAILSKWPLTQYCMNLKMANQRFASAAPPPLSPPRLPPQGQQRSRPRVPETQQPQP